MPYEKHVVIYRHYRVIGTVVARLIYIVTHYCPVKVDKAFFEIIEIQSTTVLFKGATI